MTEGFDNPVFVVLEVDYYDYYGTYGVFRKRSDAEEFIEHLWEEKVNQSPDPDRYGPASGYSAKYFYQIEEVEFYDATS